MKYKHLRIKLVLSLFVILSLIMGVSYAYFRSNVMGNAVDITIKTGKIDLDISESVINMQNLKPIYDEDYEAFAYKHEFTVSKTDDSTHDIIYDVSLVIDNIGENLRNKFLKYKLVYNDFSYDGDFSIQNISYESLPITINLSSYDVLNNNKKTSDTYTLYIWLSYSKEEDMNFINEGDSSIRQMQAHIKAVGSVNYDKIYGSSEFPSEYKGLGYIESTGTQYIDTLVYANQDTKISFDFSVDSVADGSVFKLFGARTSQNNKAFIAGKSNYNDNRIFGQFDTVPLNEVQPIYAVKDKKTNITLSKDGFYVDGVLSRIYDGFTDFKTDHSIILFGYVNDNKIGVSKQNVRVYSVKFWEKDELIRNYIPAENSKGEKGLYDSVNKEFYTNQGTGDFLSKNEEIILPREDIAVGDYDSNTEKYKISIMIDQIEYDIYLDEPLRCIGDFCDFIDLKEKKVVRRIAKYTFNSEEDFTITDSGENTIKYKAENLLNLYKGSKSLSNIGSFANGTNDKVTGFNAVGLYDKNTLYSTSVYLEIPKEYDTVEKLKDYLTSNEIYILYILKDPIIKEVDIPLIDSDLYNRNITVNTLNKPNNY